MFCRNCGKEVKDNIAFCPDCGYAFVKSTVAPVAEVRSETKKKNKNVPTWAKVISAFVGVIFGLAVFVVSVVGTVRATASHDNLADFFDEVNYDELYMGEDPLYEAAFNMTSPEIRDYMSMDHYSYRYVLRKGPMGDFATDIITGITDHVFFGKKYKAFDAEYVYDFVVENKDVFDEATDGRIDIRDDDETKQFFLDKARLGAFEYDELNDWANGALDIVSKVFSGVIFWSVLALSLGLLLLVAFLNKWKITTVLFCVGTVLLVVGMIFCAAGLACMVVPLFLGEMAAVLLCDLLFAQMMVRGVIFVVAGIVLAKLESLLFVREKMSEEGEGNVL